MLTELLLVSVEPPKIRLRTSCGPFLKAQQWVVIGLRRELYGGYTYKTCYVACSCRATNDLDNKTTLIHAYNRYPPQTIRAYLEDYGFPIDIDQYALSEMIQWVWRSAIRKKEGGNIQLAILSDRMSDLFKAWLGSDV